MGPELQRKDPRLAGALGEAILAVIMRILSILAREVMIYPKE